MPQKLFLFFYFLGSGILSPLSSAQAETPICNPTAYKCGFEMAKKDLDDRSGRAFFYSLKSPDAVCKGNISQVEPPVEVYSRILSDPQYSIYIDPKQLGCLANQPGNANDKVKTLSRYAYMQKRFDTSAQTLQDYIAYSDIMSGKKPLQNQDCKKPSALKKLQNRCEEIKKSCSGAGLAAETAKEFDAEYSQKGIQAKEARVHEINKILDGAGDRRTQSFRDVAKIKDSLLTERAVASFELMQFYAKYPWASQDDFKKQKQQGKSTQAAMVAQISINAKGLKDQLGQINAASLCLAGGSECLTTLAFNDLHDALNLTQPIPTEIKRALPGTPAREQRAANSVGRYMDYNNCLDEIGLAQKEASKALYLATAGAAASLATAGASVAATGLTNGGKVIMNAASAGTWMAKTGTMTGYALNVVNAGFTASQIEVAHEHCKGEVTRAPDASASKSGARKNSVGQCKLDAAKNAEFKQKYDDCLSQAMMAALGVAPGAMAVVSKYQPKSKTNLNLASEASDLIKKNAPQEKILNVVGKIDDSTDGGAARFQLAEKTLGRTLTKSEKEWIWKAHTTESETGYGEIGYKAVKQKVNAGAGRPSTISAADTKSLFKNGILGHADPEVVTVHGTEQVEKFEYLTHDKYSPDGQVVAEKKLVTDGWSAKRAVIEPDKPLLQKPEGSKGEFRLNRKLTPDQAALAKDGIVSYHQDPGKDVSPSPELIQNMRRIPNGERVNIKVRFRDKAFQEYFVGTTERGEPIVARYRTDGSFAGYQAYGWTTVEEISYSGKLVPLPH